MEINKGLVLKAQQMALNNLYSEEDSRRHYEDVAWLESVK